MSPKSILTLAVALAVILVSTAAPQAAAQADEKAAAAVASNTISQGLADAKAVVPIPSPPPPFDPRATWKQGHVCSLQGPGQVQGFRIQCNNASFLDFHISDCCIAGDHWELKGKNWDKAPNTAVTTSPGGAIQWSVPGRVYNYGGTVQRPRHIDAYVECTYLHGVDVFPAGSYVAFSSDGACSVTTDPIQSRINRTP